MPIHPLLIFAPLAPTLLAYNVAPSATLLNQLLCIAGWGAALAASARTAPRHSDIPFTLPVALVALMASVGWAAWLGLPSSLALSYLALLACAIALVVRGAAESSGGGDERDSAGAFHLGMLITGLASTGLALVQVFAPAWADGDVIARSGLVGRAVGNLRQPNHLSSLLMWALVAWVPLAQSRRMTAWRHGRIAALSVAALLVWAVVLSASRTGMVGVVLLFFWALFDRRLAGWVRIAVGCAPVVYLLIAAAMFLWAHTTGETFGGEMRLAEGDLSSSRMDIWANTWALIRMHPWTGVGFGEFNFAWSLTAFPGRPVAFFDHTHNLPLQLWVELGVPLGSGVLVLLLIALVQAGLRAFRMPGDAGLGSRAAFMMVLMIGVHSLLEYPLWYAYFLLPTAWAWGLALRRPAPAAANTTAPPSRRTWWAAVVGVLMVGGSLFALADYYKVVVIYAPSPTDGPLEQRILRGRGSVFFAHHADYAAATTTTPPSDAMPAFTTTTHSLLDTRLMMAWAQALNDVGQRGHASYLAARLREFRNPASADFFQVCAEPDVEPPPFQCEAPPPGLTWQDFLAAPE